MKKNIVHFLLCLWYCRKNARIVGEQSKKLTKLQQENKEYRHNIIHAARLVEEKNIELTQKTNEITLLNAKILLRDSLK